MCERGGPHHLLNVCCVLSLSLTALRNGVESVVNFTWQHDEGYTRKGRSCDGVLYTIKRPQARALRVPFCNFPMNT